MEPTNNGAPRRKPNPRRRKVNRIKRIIRAYLPLVCVLALVVLFIVFAVNSVKRADAKREQARQESIAVEESLAKVQQELEQAAKELVKEADKLAESCEFEKALALLDTFEGNPDDFDVIVTAKYRYQTGESALVPVEDITQVKCLSFGKLLVSASAFTGENAEGNRLSYITYDEFTRILQELYKNGFMLVDIYDLFTTTQAEDGSSLIVKNDLRLPQGKKPIMLIHTQPGGYSTEEFVYGGSSILPFVALLEDFIESNPGFSYKGSRAVLALTAHNGLLGLPLTDTASITNSVNHLTELGYIMACNTYSNASYGKLKIDGIKEDLSNWNISVTPLLGQTELMVYARGSDIVDSKEAYSGTKYETLYEAGFRYYFGTCYNSTPWMNITDNTIRIGRIMVNGENLTQKTAFFEGLFDPAMVVETP